MKIAKEIPNDSERNPVTFPDSPEVRLLVDAIARLIAKKHVSEITCSEKPRNQRKAQNQKGT